ncbi:MAG: hypothetical protein M1820_001216 [Bogoriella megaspora]|nr:MAG: hypothetical protein M1820_001216 [Bogoriella megaspora]
MTSPEERAEEVVDQKPKKRWQSYLWDTLDKSPEERKFLFKLDTALLTFASLGYFIKYLDQSNINNAFVSGIAKEGRLRSLPEPAQLHADLLDCRIRNWADSIKHTTYPGPSVALDPNNGGTFISLANNDQLAKSLIVPQVIWSVLTISISRCNHAKQIYVLRFFVGLAESTFYPGMQYIIGSWYRRDELAKRSCIFHTSAAIATMFSGYLMAAVYHLGGKGGFAGWQWLFIVDGIISLPIALAGYFVLPDVPEITRAFYFKKEEIAFAKKRMILEGRKPRGPYTKAKIKKIFSSWHIYWLTLLYVAFNNGAAGAAPVFAQYLKASKHPKYTIAQINAYPTTTYAVQVVSTLAYAWLSDSVLNGARWPPIVFGGIMNIICYVSLAIWTIPNGWRWTCYILSGTGYGLSGLCMAWAHEICTSDNEERAIVVGSMNEMAYVLQAWLPLIVWQQIDAPEYQKGFITISVLSVVLIGTSFVIRALEKRDGDRLEVEFEDSEEDSNSTPESPASPEEVRADRKAFQG